MNHIIKFGVLAVLTGLNACGGEATPTAPGGQMNLPPIVELTVPDYAIAGRSFTLSATVIDPEGQDVSGGWQRKGNGGSFNPVFSDQSSQTDITLSLAKTHNPAEELAVFRYVATDASGNTAIEQIELPVFDVPLNAGYALTLKAGQPVSLLMKPDEEFEQKVAGSYDTFSWSQTGGPDVSLETLDSYTANFSGPSVTEITKLTFEAQAKSSASGVEVTAEKVIFLVPESEWVEAVAIHHTENISAVLRADGSLRVLNGAEPEQLLPEVAEINDVADLNGSHHSAAVLYQDGRARTLYPLDVNHNDYLPEGLSGIKQLAGSRSASEFAGRSVFNVLTETGDLYHSGVDGLQLEDSDVSEITTIFLHGYRLNTAGEWLDSDGAVMVDQVRHISGQAYLLTDGSVGHLSRDIPAHALSAGTYVDVMAGADHCSETVFAITEDGSVDGFTPSSLPPPPELQNIVMFKASCRSHMALNANGTVFFWPGSQMYAQEHDNQPSVLSGEAPSLFNLR